MLIYYKGFYVINLLEFIECFTIKYMLRFIKYFKRVELL